jgi:hypothetical protein
MRHLRCIGSLVLGIAASGCTLVFDEPSEPGEPPVDPGPVDPGPIDETPQFKPLVCTGDPPGSPTCPFNDISLDGIGPSGARFEFLMQAVGSGVYLSHIRLAAGSDGLYIEHPALRFWQASAGVPASEIAFDVIVNLSPGQSMALGTGPSFANVLLDAISLRVPEIGPHRPE